MTVAKLYRPSDSEYWYGDYKAQSGKRVRRSTGCTVKRAAQKVLDRWVMQDIEEEEGRRTGNDSRPLQDHFTDFERAQSLACKTDTPGDTTAVDTRRWLDRLADRCGWKLLADIHADDIEAYASELREAGRSNRNIHQMIGAIRTFCRWCMRKDRMHRDPTQSVVKPSLKEDRRIQRRMLLKDEWEWLKRYLESSGARTRNGQTASERSLLYWTAIETGLRSTELRLSTKSQLKGKPEPHVAVRDSISKNAKAARQFISDNLFSALRKHASALDEGELLFSIKDRREMARVLRADVEGARKYWEEQTGESKRGFLVSKNSQGEVLDFHALRHTCGAWYVMAGLTLPEVQQIMRHSTIQLTIDDYGHLAPDAASRNRNKLGL